MTDFLPAERARGVTIQSAAISFRWPPLSAQNQQGSNIQPTGDPLVSHNINLIDTPGHADFTFEVVRSLRVLDGAICILDGVAGVEAQTEKVWRQASEYSISRIIFINKLDRDGASFGNTVKDIAIRLNTWPAVCQIPWWEGGKGRFTGLGDAINLQAYLWREGGDGKTFQVIPLKDLTADAAFGEEIKKARVALVELLSEHDDAIIEKYLEHGENHLAIPAKDIVASLRRSVISTASRIVPVFAGASFRNIGVQPLLTAIVQLLPNPQERPDTVVSLGNMTGSLNDLLAGKFIADEQYGGKSKKLTQMTKKPITAMIHHLEACALAFKVVHDARRGTLVYIRVYSGSIQSHRLLFNTNLQVPEKPMRLVKMYASDAVDIPEIMAGQIGVLTGLKHTRTGDTLISYTGLSPRSKPPTPIDSLQLRPIEIPPAVFFSSIEPHSLSEEKAVANLLALLIREDPSLQLSVDEDSGQTLLSGMGEFHLEIAGDRLVKDLKAKASMGKIEIAYRETILKPSLPEAYIFEKEIAGRKTRAGCIASVAPLFDNPVVEEIVDETEFSTIQDGNRIKISIRSSDPSSSLKDPVEDLDATEDPFLNGDPLPTSLPLYTVHNALANGALAALSRGVTHFFPLRNTDVSLTLDPTIHLFGTSTTASALSSAARAATKAALNATVTQDGSALLELVMNVTISVDEASLGTVSHDLSSLRGGHILSFEEDSIAEAHSRIDLRAVYIPPDPHWGISSPHAASFGTAGNDEAGAGAAGTRQRSITARVPLKEMIGYLKHLRSLTRGRGTFVMSPDRFERVVGSREKSLLKELRGY